MARKRTPEEIDEIVESAYQGLRENCLLGDHIDNDDAIEIKNIIGNAIYEATKP